MESWKKRQIYIYGVLIALVGVASAFGLVNAAQQQSLTLFAEAIVSVLSILGLSVAAKHAKPSSADSTSSPTLPADPEID